MSGGGGQRLLRRQGEADTLALIQPLNFIQSAARMLSRMPDTDEARELAARIYGHDVVEASLGLVPEMRAREEGGRR